MKKAHLTLLVVTAVMALFSAYSLAAMNQVYKISFEWYSQYNNKFIDEYRDTSLDRWRLEEYPKDMKLRVIGSREDFIKLETEQKNMGTYSPEMDLGKYIFIYCTLGQAHLPDYRIKVSDIAQRGNTIEVKLSVNSPSEEDGKSSSSKDTFFMQDIIRIDRQDFPIKGKLLFTFKNQDGNQMGEQFYYVY